MRLRFEEFFSSAFALWRKIISASPPANSLRFDSIDLTAMSPPRKYGLNSELFSIEALVIREWHYVLTTRDA